MKYGIIIIIIRAPVNERIDGPDCIDFCHQETLVHVVLNVALAVTCQNRNGNSRNLTSCKWFDGLNNWASANHILFKED